MDRRALFFVAAAALCTVLVPVTEAEHRWVSISLAVTYVVLALASYLDARSRRRL
jgi:hypothetical protein